VTNLTSIFSGTSIYCGIQREPDSLSRILKCYYRFNSISNSNLLHNENLSAEPLQVGNYEKLLTTILNIAIGNQLYQEGFMEKKILTVSLNGWWWWNRIQGVVRR